MSSMITFLSGLKLLSSGVTYLLEFELISINSSVIYMTILADWMSLLFVSFVLFISSMVVYYSDGYMEGDINMSRFILLIFLFVMSMMFLIISPNLISILLGWDGLGLVSYCLVIYYQNVKSYNAGMITALSNRIGDVALLMAIAWMLNFGSWNYLFYLWDDSVMPVISLLVMLAAMTKSAQIPFSSWLPAAMAAPTPVSSLVHSSTLVTAGVYLLIRFSPSFSSKLMFSLLLIASLTMFMSGVSANFEFDLKKIIALSTLSQLGLMMSILSLGSSGLAFFHLLTHALFKALLFMCAGVVIHNLNNCQDIRYMGGLSISMPLTCIIMNVSNLTLCGLPFLAGFYSKDLILEASSMSVINMLIYLLFYLSTGLTVMYSFRLVYYTMGGDFNMNPLYSMHEGGYMLKGMLGLFLMVILGGSMLSWSMFNTPWLIVLPLSLKLMTLFVIGLGAWLGLECSKFSLSYNSKSLDLLTLSLFFSSMWNIPFLSTFGVNYYPIFLSGVCYKSFDQGWSEILGPKGLYLGLIKLSKFLQLVFTNNLKVFLLSVVMWVLFII
uniref:NADH-ubiquinone oxidoreductase chain 5 n=1 Tax=Histeridae sp. BMNH 1274745 TaxID=1796511 RepID=A0A126TGL6_9COLE|nr:NADH dehydrogenase subunit 5 [Histeridae sp. BMNH 1274745]